MSVDKLKPCPFCGGEAMVIGGEDSGYAAYCQECNGDGHCEVGWFFTAEDAAEAWNTRAERTCHADRHGGYTYRFECSACGYSSLTHNCEMRMDELPRYCPNCGAKVVER